MANTYETYIEEPRALTFEEMRGIHARISNAVEGDPDAEDLYEDLLKSAVRYHGFRAEWFLQSRNERMEKDSARTSCHNSVITRLNMLSRYLKSQGRDSGWRDDLGDEAVDRKRIGDLACYLAFVNALNSR